MGRVVKERQIQAKQGAKKGPSEILMQIQKDRRYRDNGEDKSS